MANLSHFKTRCALPFLLLLLSCFHLACRDVCERCECEEGESTCDDIDKTTQAKILAFLSPNRMVMDGSNIPTHPLGYDENENKGGFTQCIASTSMDVEGDVITVTSALGTLEGAPNQGDIGTCNHDAVSNTVEFDTQSVTINNIQGNAECFDVKFDYGGFAQEGRGKVTDDCLYVHLEIFFTGSASGASCDDGAVGSNTVELSGSSFSGDAVQVYEIRPQ